MSNQTQNPQGRLDDYAADTSDGGQGHVGANPYYAQHQSAATPPDLDAGAPILRSTDVQRLNRKALFFLAGIVGLLVIAAIWMFKSATSGDDAKPKAKEEEVLIPELPKGTGLDDQAPLPSTSELPPLPQNDVAAIPVQQVPPPLPTMDPVPAEHSMGMSLMERRMANVASGDESSQQGAMGGVSGMMPPDAYAQTLLGIASQGNGGQQQQAQSKVANTRTSAQPIANPDTLLVRGTYIRCVLETRIITDISGFSSCVVTEPVYSINGRRLLLPKGSKISGSYENENITGPRVSVIWDRITTPNGLDINMASPGVDNLGGAGHPGSYNAHWGSRISSALLISLISDAFKYAGAKNGPETTTVTNSGNEVVQPYESNTARTMERLANQVLDKSLNRPPTVTINQGTIVNVYVAKDVDFSSVLR